jgi:hypothetical protein
MGNISSSAELGQASRRIVIALVYVGYGLVAFTVASEKFDHLVLPSIQTLVIGILAWLGVWLISRMSRHWRWGQAPDAMLDEREIAVRLRAYYLSYVLFNSIVFLSLIALSFVTDLKIMTEIGYSQISAVLWGVFLVGWTLPSAILAWIDRAVSDE